MKWTVSLALLNAGFLPVLLLHIISQYVFKVYHIASR